jgi:hypothetical protein
LEGFFLVMQTTDLKLDMKLDNSKIGCKCIYCDMAAETRIVEQEGKAVARERLVNMFPWQPKHTNMAMDTHATIEELLEAVCSIASKQAVAYCWHSPAWLFLV